MDYEKAYKEALERAKKEWANNLDNAYSNYRERLEIIFPELQESEDEMIRKKLITFFQRFPYTNLYDASLNAKDVLAWLEKQNEQKTANDTDEDFSVLDKVEPKFKVGDYIERKDGLGCHAKIIFVGENVYGCEKLIHSEDESPFFEFMFKNQDEFQLSSDFKQKSADTVEPKFKVGDWIVYYRDDYSREIIQIYDIRDGRYYFTDNVHFSWSVKECDEKSHLWTIQDAKEGDVLVDVYENIGIYQQHDDFDWTSYCSLGFHGGFQNFKVEHENDKTHPATKEQRDQIEKAMADAGYTFDFKEKVLKKIEPKFAWSEEDETGWTNTMIMIKEVASNHYTKDSIKLVIDWLKSLKERYTWKPSDEQIEALKEACDEHWEPDGLDPLYTLYQDLKKLREE